MKGKNIKIKHRNYSLYNKKPSKLKRALAVIITVIAAASLCVVGYGLGKPILEFLQTQQTQSTDSSDSAWSAPDSQTSVDSTVTDNSSDTKSENSQTSSAPAESDADIPEKIQSVFMLPVEAAKGSESLNGALAAAKNSGCGAAVVTLKDDNGSFLYSSDIEGIKGSEAISGTLTAKQIYDIIEKSGLTPIAKISTLKDHSSSAYVDGIKFMFRDGSYGWLDATAENGGKTWLTPFSSKTVKFISSIVSEVTKAGFKNVIIADTVFPVFNAIDFQYLDKIDDNAKRLDALWNVISACSSAARRNGANIIAEVSSEDLTAADKLSTTAEIAGDTDKLKEIELLIDYNTDSDASSAYAQAKMFIGQMSATLSKQKYSVLIKSGGFSQAVIEDTKKAFSDDKITVYSE